MKLSRRLLSFSLAVALVVPAHLAVLHAAPDDKIFVTNGNDNGPGSFRAAIEAANTDPAITKIRFKPDVGCVFLSSTIYYTGTQDLSIDGNNTLIEAEGAGGDAFVSNGGPANLEIRFLTIKNAPGEGIEVQVPANATGVQSVRLFNVTVHRSGGHGVLINDQEDDFTPEPPATANPNGSDASLEVIVEKSLFSYNGYTVSDRDGIRVNEGGDGSLTFKMHFSDSFYNAADGVEIDERGDGDVNVDMFESVLEENGSFDSTDLDDGFDIDESGPGSVVGKIAHSSAINNYEEGFDFNENDGGDLRVDFTRVEATGNGEEGIDLEEDDDFAGGGALVTSMSFITANANKGGDAGLKIREKGLGNLEVDINEIETKSNQTGGISIREDGDGHLTAKLDKITSASNTGHGIDFDENSTGNLTAEVGRSSSTSNGGVGLRADQQTAGTGALQLWKVVLTGNTGGAQSGNNVTTTVMP